MSAGKGIVILGAGGHAKVVVEIFRAAGETVHCCVEEEAGAAGDLMGVPILIGEKEHLPRLMAEGYTRAHVAIGSNKLRAKIAGRLVEMGFSLASAVHPRATVSASATLGDGVAVMAGAVINACARVGGGTIINTGATVDHDCQVGDFAHIGPQCGLCGNVQVGEGAFLGVGTKVIPGKLIGDWSVAGAGSVIVRDVPEKSQVMGVPARIAGSR